MPANGATTVGVLKSGIDGLLYRSRSWDALFPRRPAHRGGPTPDVV